MELTGHLMIFVAFGFGVLTGLIVSNGNDKDGGMGDV